MTFDLNSTVQELQVHYKSCWSTSTLASGHITVLLSMYLSILSDFYESINCLRHFVRTNPVLSGKQPDRTSNVKVMGEALISRQSQITAQISKLLCVCVWGGGRLSAPETCLHILIVMFLSLCKTDD